MEPRPLPALSHVANFATYGQWPSVEYGPNVTVGGPHLPTVAEAGKPYRIAYWRNFDALGLQGAPEKVELSYRIDGGEVKTVVLAEGEAARSYLQRKPFELAIPAEARGELEYWFKLTGSDGAEVWDSHFGNNYRADIVPAGGSLLAFDDGWNESLSQPLRPGQAVRIAYDVDRIKPHLSGLYHHGAATWDVVAHVSFDGGPVTKYPLTAPRQGQYGFHLEKEPVLASLQVPEDARSMAVWIEGRAYGGGAWDSDFGRNYVFDVQR